MSTGPLWPLGQFNGPQVVNHLCHDLKSHRILDKPVPECAKATNTFASRQTFFPWPTQPLRSRLKELVLALTHILLVHPVRTPITTCANLQSSQIREVGSISTVILQLLFSASSYNCVSARHQEAHVRTEKPNSSTLSLWMKSRPRLRRTAIKGGWYEYKIGLWRHNHY